MQRFFSNPCQAQKHGMKKLTFTYGASFGAILCCLFFTGCLKDKVTQTYTIYRPVYKTLSQVRANMKSSVPQQLAQTGKLSVYNNYIFLNEINKGIHVIDNSNPAAPKNIAFINIPGNIDLAIKDNYLYADSYSD